jgi:hypothetical protein
MEPNYTNQTMPPVEPATPPPAPEMPGEKTEEKSSGPIVAVVIIVAIVIAGGLYMWKSGALKKTAPPAAPTNTETAASEISDIETSLNTIDLSADSGLDQLETQF